MSKEIRGPRPRRLPDAASPFMTIEQIRDLVPISRSKLYTMIDEGVFPDSIKLGKRSVVWNRSVVMEWIENALKVQQKPTFKTSWQDNGRDLEG